MNQEQIKNIVQSLRNDTQTQEIIALRGEILNNKLNAAHALAESIRKTSVRTYKDLEDNSVSLIISDIQNQFDEISHYRMDDWQSDEVLERMVSVHEYVRTRLAETIGCECQHIKWGIVGRIINAVFGNVPIITKGVRKALRESNLLSHQFTESIRTLLVSIRDLWQIYQNDIIDIVGELVINGCFYIGMNLTPQQIVINLAPLLLTNIFRVVSRSMRREQTHNY